MAKDPAFLFYSQDFFLGTSTMSFEDRGKFITILCLMHQQGRLNEESICFVVGSISLNLKKKFIIDENGLWYNDRLEIETKKRNKYTESRRDNGLLGGRGHKKDKSIIKANAKHMQKHMGSHMEDENENENINEIIIKKENYSNKKFTLESCIIEFQLLNQPDKDAINFFNHYESQGWLKGNGQAVASLRALVSQWVRNPEKKPNFAKTPVNIQNVVNDVFDQFKTRENELQKLD